jgi:hypothetical protein
MTPEPLTFRATLLSGGKTATGMEVPPDVVEALGAGRQPLVQVTIGEHSYRSKIAVRGGGRFMIPVSAANRGAAGIEVGDEIDVAVAVDTEPRVVELPADFAEALDAEPEARRFFDGLSPSRKGAFVTGIEGAKTQETRERRIGKSVARLRDGSPTP